MDCTSVLLKKIFPDSNVAKNFSSGRTTTEKVVTSVLAQYSIDAVYVKADTIAIYVKDTLEKRMLLKKCVAFTVYNCNTMFGGLRHNA